MRPIFSVIEQGISVRKAQLLRQTVVHAAVRSVQIGVHADGGDTVSARACVRTPPRRVVGREASASRARASARSSPDGGTR